MRGSGDGPGGGRKAGSAQLMKMHDPVPKGGSIREALSQVNNKAESRPAPQKAKAHWPSGKWMGVVNEAPKRPVAPAWNPGGRAAHGAPAGGANEAARQPHLGFRNDYHKHGPQEYVKAEKAGVRPYR